MKKAVAYLSARKSRLLIWMVLFAVSAISIYLQRFFYETAVLADRLVRGELVACVSFFLLALVPLNYLRVGSGIVRRLRLNHAWGIFALMCASFALVCLLFSSRISSAAELRMLCFLPLPLALLCVDADNLAKAWFVPMTLLALGSWLFAKFFLKGGNSFGMFVAAAVSVRLLLCGKRDKKMRTELIAYLILSFALPLFYEYLFEPQRINSHIVAWQSSSSNPFLWRSNSTSVCFGVIHIATAGVLLLLTKMMSGCEKKNIFFLIGLALTFILLDFLAGFNNLRQGVLVIMPFQGVGGALLNGFLANYLLYYDLIPFKALREEIAKLRKEKPNE